MKKENTKEKILLKVEEKLLRRKIHSVSLDDVAKELKISKRTIYEIFYSKDEIYENIILRFHAELKKHHSKMIADIKNDEMSIFDGIEEFMKFVFRYKHLPLSKLFDKFPKHITKIKEDTMYFLDILLDLAKKRNVIRQDFDKGNFYLILKGVLYTIVTQYDMDLGRIAGMCEIICFGLLTKQTQEEVFTFI